MRIRTQSSHFNSAGCGWAALILAVLLTSLSPGAGQTTCFYVAPDGNDAWSGRSAAPNAERTDGPFATPQRACDAVRELKQRQEGALSQPVTVLLRGGLYFLTEPLRLNAGHAGTEQFPITYAAYRDEKPVISGGRRIRGWQPVELDGRTVWAADLPEVREGERFFHQLWVNGHRSPRARYPKQGYARVAAVPEAPERWQEGGNRFRFHESDLGTWAVDGDTEVVVMSRWVESHLPVERVDERERIVSFSRRSVFRLDPGDLYYVEHAQKLLESPGEWYLDRNAGDLYLMPPSAATLESLVVVAPVLQEVMRVEGDPARGQWVEHLTFRGLTFAHTEWHFPPGSNMDGLRPDVPPDTPYVRADVGGCPQAAARVPAAVTLSGARQLVFEQCVFTNVGGYAIELGRGCQNNRISGCTMSDLGAGGVKIGETLQREAVAEQTFGNEVADCHIFNGGRVFHSAVGLWIGQSYSNHVAHNLIHDFYYSGISVGWTWMYGKTLARGNVIEGNHVHHLGKLSNGDGPILSDMGGVYTVGTQPGTVIRNNFFHDIAGLKYGGWGIYLDEGSSYMRVESNLVTHTTHGAFHQHYGRENLVRNNIFAFGRAHQIHRIPAERHLSFTFENNIVYWTEGKLIGGKWGAPRVVFDHNLYWNVGREVRFDDEVSFDEWWTRGNDRNSRVADPMFVAAEKGDFRLRPGSPALELGFQPLALGTVGPRSLEWRKAK